MHKCIEGDGDGAGRCVMGGWKMGGDGVQEEGEEREREEEEEGGGGCSAAVERSERRLQSLLMGEIRLCCQRSEGL